MKLLSKKENVSIVNLVNGRKQLRTTKIKMKTKYVVSVVTFVDDEVNWSENKFTKRHLTQNVLCKVSLGEFILTGAQKLNWYFFGLHFSKLSLYQFEVSLLSPFPIFHGHLHTSWRSLSIRRFWGKGEKWYEYIKIIYVNCGVKNYMKVDRSQL